MRPMLKIANDHGDMRQEQPEIALIRGIIDRAIRDALKPSAERTRYWSPTVSAKRIKRKEELEQFIAEWKASKLPAHEFVTLKGGDIKKFERDRKWLSHYEGGRAGLWAKGYPTAQEWMWDSSVEPFSFLWCLSFFFDDAESMAEKIKKYVLLSLKSA